MATNARPGQSCCVGQHARPELSPTNKTSQPCPPIPRATGSALKLRVHLRARTSIRLFSTSAKFSPSSNVTLSRPFGRGCARATFPRSRVVGGKSMWLSTDIEAWLATLPVRKLKGDTSEALANVGRFCRGRAL